VGRYLGSEEGNRGIKRDCVTITSDPTFEFGELTAYVEKAKDISKRSNGELDVKDSSHRKS